MEKEAATTSWSSFVRSLLRCGERAAHIARTIRSEESLFSLLIEEKTGASNTKLSGSDFKTLADVLIQCCIEAQLTHEYPCLAGRIHGEEESTFTNQLGESIRVVVDVCSDPGNDAALRSSVDSTASLLCSVLDRNQTASSALASAVHEPLDTSALEDEVARVGVEGCLDLDRIAFWLDPIDNTSGYINSAESADHSDHAGIHCVTVLLGVYDVATETPIAGVVAQPFYRRSANCSSDTSSSKGSDCCWNGRTLWGVSDGDTRFHSESLKQATQRTAPSNGHITVIGSRHERSSLVRCLESTGNAEVTENQATSSEEQTSPSENSATSSAKTSLSSSPSELSSSSGCRGVRFVSGHGAGYKALCVATGDADAYLLSTPSTYMWDTCAVQAVLSSMGGVIVNYTDALHSVVSCGHVPDWSALRLRYSFTGIPGEDAPKRWCNTRGLLAVRDVSLGKHLLSLCPAAQGAT
ncbi:inositol polyphosphate 1-phosphatase-like [Sycon ciliatum]|uniref:inositol polyphosphate 1-phosphatase-like n=1 Tax=Sycon ciliatum TaxID=27933 RepID=UPI0031F64909